MSTPTSRTHWHDQSIIPKNYDDIDDLINIARKARRHIVEFDWMFTQEDLLRLRRGVFEWGTHVVGRYKCFDARVLAVINDALGDKNTVFVLNEPKNSRATDCNASCTRDGQMFRLQGHAPFDIVFGYGTAGTQPDLTASAYLGPTVQKLLVEAVEMLDWDIRRLQEERFRSVLNALYGLRLDYGSEHAPPQSGPAMDLAVHFHGPFSTFGDLENNCLFTDEMAKCTGVYLWTINVDGKARPWYVGQTRRGFGQRMAEHIACFLSGEYTTYDAEALSLGKNQLAQDAVIGIWPQTLPSFLQNYETLMPNIAALIRLFKFHVAPLVGDAHLLNRVEGSIGRHFRNHANPELRDFFTPGIKLPAAILYDTPMRLVLTSEVAIAGLPSYLAA